MEQVIAREKTIKKWPRDWKCNLIERQNPEWNGYIHQIKYPVLSGSKLGRR